MHTEEQKTKRGPGFWKFNNSLLTDSTYIELITKSIPEFVTKYLELEDKGLLWEMIKIWKLERQRSFLRNEKLNKRKTKSQRELQRELQIQLRSNFNESIKVELDRVKRKLEKITAARTRGKIIRSKTRWYEFGEKNCKHFYNLDKRNHRKKHITSLKKQNNTTITNPKEILEEEPQFFKEIYESKSPKPYDTSFSFFFDSDELTPLQS